MLRFILTLLMFSGFTIANGQNYRWVQFIKSVSGSPEESITRVVYNDGYVYALGEFSKNITNGTDTVKISNYRV